MKFSRLITLNMASIMATKGSKHPKKREVAKLVTDNRQPCVFCNEDVDDEEIYGKLYALGDIQCHYFCVLLSCCLVQKGRDSEGLFGFLYKDIQAEVERSKKHKCSYCGLGGASLGCSVAACRKQFHLPCGRRKNVVSLFYGNYKSFCERHAPKQNISQPVMVKAKERMKREKLIRSGKIPVAVGNIEDSKQTESPGEPALLCVICYEDVQAYPTTQTFWPPCCGRDAWLHRICLQRMALSAGMHYLKCPLCNDKDNFCDAVCGQGYYLPDRDAAWELEQDAFAEQYARDAQCAAAACHCPFGRGHDEPGTWDMKLCLLCGSWAAHAGCAGVAGGAGGAGVAGGARAVCAACRPAANDIEQLEAKLTAVTVAEQARSRRRGPVMPARMSLRRTKRRPQHSASSSSQMPALDSTQNKTETPSPATGRLSLNRKAPRRAALRPGSRLLSPVRLLERLHAQRGGGQVQLSQQLLDNIRIKFSKPKPLSAKMKIANEILDDLLKNMFKENSKSKEPVVEWNSPRKACHITSELNEEEKDSPWPLLNANIETEASENVDNNNPADSDEKVDMNKSEVNKLDEENCEKEDHQDIKHIPEKESKLDEESNKPDLNDINDDKNSNIRDADNIRDAVMTDNIRDAVMTDNIRDAVMSDNIRDAVMTDNIRDAVMTDNIRDAVMTDNIRDAVMSDNIRDAVMSDNIRDAVMSDNIRDAVMSDNIRDAVMSDNIRDAVMSDNIRDAVMTDNDKDDESSRSTFQLPSEFTAESEDSLPIIETPKKLKMVDIKHDSSIEISEQNEMLNIDVVQIGSGKEKEFIQNLTMKTPVKNRMCSFKFSPLDKEPLQEDVDMDVESFKDKYLNEVGRDKSSLNHLKSETVLRSVDVNIESGIKRKLDMQDGVVKKRRKRRQTKKRRLKIKIKMNDKNRSKKIKKIEELQLKKRLTKIKVKEQIKKNKKMKIKSYKQYVLKYSSLQTSKVIAKPDVEVAPMKRKYIKLDKSPDNLVQTSIQNFFKAK